MLCWGTEYDERLRGYARELGVDVEIFPSNIEGENRLYAANDERFDAAIRRGPASQTAAVSQSVVAGFGIAWYALALRGIRDLSTAEK